VDASAPKLRAFQRSLQKACEALDAFDMRQAQLESAETEMDRSEESPEGDDAKDREKNRQRAEQLLARAQKLYASGAEELSQVIQTMVERAGHFADSFSQAPSRKVTKAELQAAQVSVRGTFRSLSSCWQSMLKAHESRAKAVSSRRKAVQKRQACEMAHVEAKQRLAEAQAEYSEATTELAVTETNLSRCESEVASSDAARNDAERQEIDLKRRREELRATLAAAKDAMKPARSSEKEAIAQRQAIYSACTRVEGAQQKMEEAKSSAVQKLKTEEYLADQVERAYVRAQSMKSGGG